MNKLKESNIEWIGKIPENWKYNKMKYLLNITTGSKDANAEEPDGIYEFFTCSIENKKINNYEFDDEALLVAGNGIVGYTKYYNGKFDAYQRTYVLTNFYKTVNPIFLKHYFNVLLPQKLEYNKVGSVIDFIKLGDLKDFIIFLPTIYEQQKIANYLDDKVSKIDKFIEKTNKEIEIIKEYRLNYITHLIDKYKNKSTIIRLRYLGNLINGISAGSDKFQNGNDTFINYGDVYNNITIPDNPVGKVNLTEKEKNIYSLKEGDILFTRTSETIEEVGFSSVCLKDYPNSAFSGFVIRFRPNNKYYMNPNFYKYYFKMREHRDFFAREMNLVTRASLSQNLLDNLPVYIFNKEIQDLLSSKLDKIYNITDNIIELKQNLIEKIEEYKKSLIYEVVTGKKEI